MTYREGRKVKTKNRYLGPASGGFGSGAPSTLPTAEMGTPVRSNVRRAKTLKLDPIIRWNDLTAEQQKKHLQTSKRLIAADARRELLAPLTPEERKDLREREAYEREKRRERRKLQKEKPQSKPSFLQRLNFFTRK